MRTIHTSLPIYDSVDKQDKNLVNALTAVACPRHRLPAFQFEHSLPIIQVFLVDCEGDETDISAYFRKTATLVSSWTNNGYDTFSASADVINSAIKTTAAGSVYAETNTFSVEQGDVIRVDYTITQNSGTAPTLYVVNSSGDVISNIHTPDVDFAMADFKITETDTATLRIANAEGEATNFYFELAGVYNTYFPHKIDLTTDYIQYTGGILNTLLPKGSYYLRLIDSDSNSFYSEYFIVDDIYPNLITGFPADVYDTFVSSGTTITSAITAANGQANSSIFQVRAREVIKVVIYLTVNSGAPPTLGMLNQTGFTDNVVLSSGLNEINLTMTEDGDAQIRLFGAYAQNFSTNEIVVIRGYSDEYIKIDFSNTYDIPTDGATILYSQDFVDTVWLPTQMGVPSHETIKVGSEKNGVFIPEKIISVFTHQIVDYIGRSLYRALARLPLHDSISIIDTVGNDYNPSHDISVAPLEWSHFDIGTLRITFNEDGSVWTNNLTNLT